jgi:hypothetical protein
MRPASLTFALLMAPLLAAPGCGDKGGVWVTGKLVKGADKYVSPPDQRVSVTLVVIDATTPSGKPVTPGEAFAAEVDQAEGTFTVTGPERQGIPPGKYRVAVTQKMKRDAFAAKYPKPKRGVDREQDMLADKFSMSSSPITCDVSNTGSNLVIDLALADK